MTGTRELLREVAAAATIELPLGFSWFRRPGPVPSAEVTAALTAEQARAYLKGSLQYHLYSHFYCRGRATATRTIEPRDPAAAEAFVDRLSAANAGMGAWQDGWELQLWLDGGAAVACRNGLSVRVEAADWHSTSKDPILGSAVSLRLPKEARARQPNFYVALSDSYFDADQVDALVRLYWNVSADGAAELARNVTILLNRAEIPFGLKLVNDPAAYDRCDSGVLYLHRDSWAAAARLLSRIHAAVAPGLRPPVPAFTKRLAAGLGFAEDPSDQESFGLTRCGLVAEGLLRAAEANETSTEERMRSILDCFREQTIDPDRPYLNPGSPDSFELPDVAVGVTTGISTDAPPATADAADEEFASTAEDIATRLCQEAIWHGQRCTWIGADPSAFDAAGLPVRRWTALDGSLYSGTAGVAVFLARVAVLRGDDARMTALGAARHAVGHAAQHTPDHLLGLYTGGLGTALAVAHVGRLLNDPDLVGAAAELAHCCLAGRPPARERDVINGDAGAIVALLGLAELLNDETLGAATETVAREMVMAADHDGDAICWPSGTGPALTGFSHGAAGMAWALRELDARRPDAVWREAARAAGLFERRWFDAEAGNWRDRREIPGGEDFMTAWCHGAPGVVLSRLCAPGLDDDAECRRESAAGLTTTRRWLRQALDEQSGDYSLCHGLSGAADILLQIGRQVGNPEDERLAVAVGRYGVDSYAHRGRAWPCGTRSGETPSLMLGLSGIGWFFLRFADPEVPSLLLPGPDIWRPATTTAAALERAPERLTVRAAAPATPAHARHRGRITNDELGAVVRLGLLAGGFRPQAANDRVRAARWAAGVPLRDRFLPSRLPAYADVSDYLLLPEADTQLWNSLPLVLTFGHEQAEALLAVSGERDDGGEASRTCALFSALLSTFDYVADESVHRDALYAVEPVGLAALTGDGYAADALRGAYQQHPAPAVRLVCALFGMVAAALHNAASCVTDPAAIDALRRRIRRLFAAERTSTLGSAGTPGKLPQLARASREKSVLPFDVLLRLACLVATGRPPSVVATEAARGLGRAICLADDLVDLLTDLDRNAPSPLVVTLTERAQGSSDPATVDDTALLAVVADGTADLLAAVRSVALTPGGDGSASNLRDFTFSVVARWVGWHDHLESPDAASAAVRTLPLVTAALAGRRIDGEARTAVDAALAFLGEPGLAAALRERLEGVQTPDMAYKEARC